MLPKIAFLAVALQVALSSAHVEQANGKDLLVELNTPGTTHRHLIPIKNDGTIQQNATNGPHDHGKPHGTHPHKSMPKHGKGKNGIEGKLHGGPEKFNGTQGHHDMERRQEAVHHGHEKGDGNGSARKDKTDHSHGHAHHNKGAKGKMHGGHGKVNGTHTPGVNGEDKGHHSKETRKEDTAHFGYGNGKGHEVEMDASHGHGHHDKGAKGKIHGGHGKPNGTATHTPGENGKGKGHHNTEIRSEGAGHHSIETRQVGGNAILANRCYYDVWVWSVEEGYSSSAIYVPARTIYTEPKRAPANGGVVLKVSRTDQLMGGQQTQFEYATSNGMIYYDISFVDCATGTTAQNCPGWDMGLNIGSPEPACQTVNCPSNSYCTDAAYFVDTPLQKLGLAEPVFGCGAAGTGMDIYFHTCSDTPQLTKREMSGRSVAGRIGLE